MSTDDGGRAQRLGRQNIQTVLAQVEQDAFHLRAVFHPESYRKLDRNPEGAPAFALHQGHGGAQAGFGLLLRNGFIENEICARAENVAHLGLVAEQGHGDGLVRGRRLVGVLQDQGGAVGIVVVDDHGVEFLLGQAAERVGIAAALHAQAETGQDGREHSRRLFVFANQKRLKCHMRALCPNSTLAGLRPARSAWRRLGSGGCTARRR